MRAQIISASKAEMYELISLYGRGKFDVEQEAFFRKCVSSAGKLWTGFVDGELVCMWGLIPPSFLSEHAYLWLYTTPALAGNEFTFVRQSQIAVGKMLLEYRVIIGHAAANNERGIRWLKWLGAEFDDPIGQLIPFTIRKK